MLGTNTLGTSELVGTSFFPQVIYYEYFVDEDLASSNLSARRAVYITDISFNISDISIDHINGVEVSVETNTVDVLLANQNSIEVLE